MTIRNRLALAGAAVVLVVWTLLSLGVYAAVERGAIARLDAELVRQEQQLRRMVRPGLRGAGGAGQLPLRLARRELLAQVIGPDGTVRQRSDPLEQLGGIAPPPDVSALTGPAYSNERAGGVALRVRTVPLARGAVQVALPRGDVDALLMRLRRMLFVAAILGTALAAAIGRFLAASALAPVSRLTTAAQRITQTRDLSERVPEPHTDRMDEVGELATTFNSMIGSLERQRQSQQLFVADASHELRTPLTSLRGNAEFLARPDLEHAAQRDAAEAVIADVDRLDRIAADLLALARLDAQAEPQLVAFAAGELFERVRMRHANSMNGRTLTVDEQTSGIELVADPALLESALSNLVVNAVRYTHPGTDVHLRARLLPTREVELAVSDDGPGMSADDAARAFDRFHRGSTAHGTDGTGLGLAIVRAAALAHGGEAQLSTQPGGGCTVAIRLPATAVRSATVVSSGSRSS